MDMLLLTSKLNLKSYVFYETKGLLTITKMYISIIIIFIFIINVNIINIINIAEIIVIIIIIIIFIIIAFIIICIRAVENNIFTFQKQPLSASLWYNLKYSN